MEILNEKTGLTGKTYSVKGHAAFVIPPPYPLSGGTTPWVWYAPTLFNSPGQDEKWMFEKFLAAGIAIAGIDVGESYGSPGGRALYSTFYEDVMIKSGFSKKVCLLARSRGGLMLYNWAAENSSLIACIAGIYPVCNLVSYPGIAKACGAYNLTEKQLSAQLSRNNPIDRLEPLAKAQVPIFHIHGDIDEVVPLEKNSGLLAERYRRIGGNITLKVVEGQGHNLWPGWFQCQELVDFIIAHAIIKQE